MIGKLNGLVDEVANDHLIVDVNGVGYQVFATRRTLAGLPRRGAPIALHIETHMREDHIHLYGFPTADERRWYRLLTGVQGVGSRVALAILSALAPDALLHALAAQDRAALTRADGVGPKLALRILTELKDKVGDISLGRAAPVDGPAVEGPDGMTTDAISALVNLGYGRSDAFVALRELAR